MSTPWDVIEEVGGAERMEAMMRAFYDRLFDDLMIGFFFMKSDKEALIASQIAFVHAHLGSRQGDYAGPPIRRAHQQMPILVGHFDRRHQILREVLDAFSVPEHVKEAWLGLDRAMRDMVIRQGDQAREELGYAKFRPDR
ncbi:group I truncated hemoglobin [Lujinxingia litoralis]|nr:group 1 truncated hemoglobin [Lujinxingia litoralis]